MTLQTDPSPTRSISTGSSAINNGVIQILVFMLDQQSYVNCLSLINLY